MKSKIVIFREANQPLEIVSWPIPALTEGQILVRNEYTTLCRSDLSTYSGKRKEKSPTILGHEIVGRIAAFGPEAPQSDCEGNPLCIGDRITWAIYASDPTGEMAQRGIPQKAPDLFKYGHEQLTPENSLHGGLAEYTLLRKHTPILKLREEVPLQVTAIINCAVSTVAGSLRLAGELKGKRVGIWGAGMLGVIACAMCHNQGAQEILALDIQDERLSVAQRFGATRLVNTTKEQLTDNQLDVTIDFSGHIQCMKNSIEALAIGGTAVWIGGVCPQAPVPIDSEQFIRKLRTLKGLHNYNLEDFRTAVTFIQENYQRYPIADLIYDGFDLEHAEEAFQYALRANPYRVGIHINPEENCL